MHKIKYKGYDIEAKPYKSNDSSEWKIDLLISRDLASREFYPKDTLKTQEEAVRFCFDLGVRIIDGEAKDYSVEDL
jgi:hypothetical protein